MPHEIFVLAAVSSKKPRPDVDFFDRGYQPDGDIKIASWVTTPRRENPAVTTAIALHRQKAGDHATQSDVLSMTLSPDDLSAFEPLRDTTTLKFVGAARAALADGKTVYLAIIDS